MFTLIVIIHIICCLFLISVVLLQQGKGADMGAVFGGSSSTIFGSGGAGNFLTRLTTGAAVVFMLTSLTLTYASARRLSSTVFDSGSLPEPPPVSAPANPEGQAPAGEPQPAAPQAAAPQAAEPQAAAPAQQAAPAN
jgi:preprotein translocase subunit SecG